MDETNDVAEARVAEMPSNDTDATGVVGPQIIFMLDTDGRCTLSVGPGLDALGLEQNQLVGADLFAVYDTEESHRSFHRVLAGERFTEQRVAQGRSFWTFWQPLVAFDGSIEGAIGVTTDMTEHQRMQAEAATARERVSALSELSNSLALHVDDLEAMLLVAVRSATDLTAEYGAIWLRGKGNVPEPRAVWHRDDKIRKDLWALTAQMRGRPGWHDMSNVSELSEPVQFDWSPEDSQTTHNDLDDISNDLFVRITGRLGAHMALRVPMRSRGRLVGFMDLARSPDQGEFPEADLPFVRDLVDRCTLALDNALLWREQRAVGEELVKFEALADASQELIQITDVNDRTVYVNRRLSDLALGGSNDEGLWEAAARVVGLDTMLSMRQAVENGERWSGEVTLASDSEVAIVHADVFALYHPQTSAQLGTAWMARDITGLRDSESALRATNAELVRFRALVEASPDFIAIASLDGSVRYVNPAGRALIELDPEIDVTQTTITDYLTPEGVEASLRVEQPAVIAHGHWEGESTLRHRSGRSIHVAIASFLMQDPVTGEPFALATVQRDITERLAAGKTMARLGKQREALLERLVEAEARERAMIAADVHDDSVQAMAAVDLRLGLLGRQIIERAPDLLEPVKALQKDVSKATERLRILLFDLEEPDLHYGLGEALRWAADLIFAGQQTQIRIDAGAEPDAPDALRAVGYRIAREALVNSFKHARASQVDVSVTGAGNGLQITVADDGVGISVKMVASPPGHYGLSGMSDRAAVLGGTCEISARDPRGTVVTIWLPGPESGSGPAPAGG